MASIAADISEIAIPAGTEAEGLIKPNQLARRLGITRGTLQTLIAEGKIKGIRVGSQWRFRYSEVERQLKEQTQ